VLVRILIHTHTYDLNELVAAAVLFGVVGGTVCNFATQLKFLLGYDDALDIFATHGVGGMVGNLLTGLFAQASVAAFDGTVIAGGWLDHHYIQLAYQLADSAAGFGYSFVMTVSRFISSYTSQVKRVVSDHHPMDHALHPWSPLACL